MVNGYWFPSLAAAAEAPAGKGFDFAKAAEAAATEAARAKEERRQLKVPVFWSGCWHQLVGMALMAEHRRKGGVPASCSPVGLAGGGGLAWCGLVCKLQQ